MLDKNLLIGIGFGCLIAATGAYINPYGKWYAYVKVPYILASCDGIAGTECTRYLMEDYDKCEAARKDLLQAPRSVCYVREEETK